MSMPSPRTGRRAASQLSGPWGMLILASGLAIALLFALLIIADPRAIGLVIAVPALGLMLLSLQRALSGDRRFLLALLVLSVFVIDAVFRVRSYSDKSLDFQVVLKAGIWACLFGIGMLRLNLVLSHIVSRDRVLWTTFYIWMMVTTAWAPNPLYALVAGFSLISFYVFFSFLITRFTLQDIVIGILIGTVLLAIGSLLVYVAVPTLGRARIWAGNQQILSGRLSGLAGNANSIGRICCFGLIIVALCWRRLARMGRFLPLASAAILAVTLILSNSRTSMLVAALVIGIHFLVRGRNFVLLFTVLSLGFVLLMALMPFSEQLMIALSRSGRADELATGTSRTLIWNVVTMLAWQKPLTGWGYGSTVFVLPLYEQAMGHAAPHAHNIIMQLWLTTGFIGVALFVAAFTSRLVLAVARGERLILALLLFVIFNGLTESSAFGGIANITSIALALAAVAREPRAAPVTPPRAADSTVHARREPVRR